MVSGDMQDTFLGPSFSPVDDDYSGHWLALGTSEDSGKGGLRVHQACTVDCLAAVRLMELERHGHKVTMELRLWRTRAGRDL
jgi:hypothetical protein